MPLITFHSVDCNLFNSANKVDILLYEHGSRGIRAHSWQVSRAPQCKQWAELCLAAPSPHQHMPEKIILPETESNSWLLLICAPWCHLINTPSPHSLAPNHQIFHLLPGLSPLQLGWLHCHDKNLNCHLQLTRLKLLIQCHSPIPFDHFAAHHT